ncbi:MAG: dihydroorotase [Erysipelotrichaceae bacterium]
MMLIKNAKINTHDNKTVIKDILIEDSKIVKIEDDIEVACKTIEVFEAHERLILPGLIDVHVHLREPGYTDKETIHSGTMAAAHGGFTTIMAMPNVIPHPDRVEVIKEYLEKIESDAVVNVVPYATITINEAGKEIVDMKNIVQLGLRAFSDDGVGIQSDEIMQKAMHCAKENQAMIVAHTEDMKYRKPEACMHEGSANVKLGYIGIPSECEYKQLERDLKLAKEEGCRYHVCHMSAKESVKLLAKYKKQGANVSGEVTTHHLLLNEDDVVNANTKMNPPLRSKEDQKALIEGLKSGTIDMIANDHAPHTEEEKMRGMVKAPFGIVSLETSLALLYTRYVKEGIFTIEELIRYTSLNPAKRFNFRNKGKIAIGYDADLVMIDENTIKKVDVSKFQSKGKNTPFDGVEACGWPIMTMVGGVIKYKEEIK